RPFRRGTVVAPQPLFDPAGRHRRVRVHEQPGEQRERLPRHRNGHPIHSGLNRTEYPEVHCHTTSVTDATATCDRFRINLVNPVPAGGLVGHDCSVRSIRGVVMADRKHMRLAWHPNGAAAVTVLWSSHHLYGSDQGGRSSTEGSPP